MLLAFLEAYDKIYCVYLHLIFQGKDLTEMYERSNALTAQHSTAQHSTAQHSTAQHSTALTMSQD